eukprot:COSAG01_NODE_37922_length_497_cov_0.457286_2_plen_52_part_01
MRLSDVSDVVAELPVLVRSMANCCVARSKLVNTDWKDEAVMPKSDAHNVRIA